MDWGTRLREFRLAARKTQEEMALMMGMSRGHYAQVEVGKVSLPAKYIEAAEGLVGKIMEGPTGGELKYVGTVAAGARLNWTDVQDTSETVAVNKEMYQAGSFCAHIGGDSQFDYFWPGDLVVFAASPTRQPRLNRFNLIARRDGADLIAAVKIVANSDGRLVLRSFNRAYADEPFGDETDIAFGFAIGFIRELGSTVIRVFDPNGLNPNEKIS